MKALKKALALVLAAAMVIQPISVSAAETTSKPADGTTTNAPFPKGTAGSNSFRIPSLVTLSDGTLVAAADARWNTTYDGGGLDTIVSRSSDNGKNWNYTFANYLGDNGNTYNGSSSTCFIDPAMAVTSDDTIYMLVDLYPYGIALNGSGNTAPSTEVGFDSDGNLKLKKKGESSYNYYLKDEKIYSTSGTVVDGYTVDEHFNIKGTDETDSNLFFEDSPFQVVRTGYLYLTKSTDKGTTWSAPTLLNLKTSSEQVCLVGPGRGLVTSSGMIVFPVYSYNGSQETQKMGFVYSTDGSTWNRTSSFTGATWSSESAVIELTDGTLRFFYRNGTKNLCYVDYSNGTWGSVVNTGQVTNSNCQISAITYSKTVDEKQVILVSCPTGPNEAGSDQSGASYRENGKIFVGLVNSDKTITWQNNAKISVQSENSTESFMYSCLTELSDGSIAILYEDNENGWGTGSDKYYQMSFATYEASKLGLTFDETNEGDSSENGSNEDKDVPSDDTTLNELPEEYTGEVSNKTTEATSYWQLVTNGVSGIASGEKYLIASGKTGSVYLLGYTGGSSKTTVSNNVISSASEDYQFTLTGSGNTWTIQDKNGTYLYPTATKSSSGGQGGPGGNSSKWTCGVAYKQNTANSVMISGSSYVTISRSVTSGKNKTTSYLSYSGSSFGASESSSTLYLYKQVTVPGTTCYTVDTTGLEKLIAEVPTAQENYTDETWEAFQNALAGAKMAISNTAESYDTESDASNQQTNINDAAFMLYKAWQELKEYKTIEITINYKLDTDTVKTETISVLENATKVSLSKIITGSDDAMYSVENTELSLNNAQKEYDVAVTKLEGYPVTVSQGSTLTVSPADPYGDGTIAGIELKDGQYVKWTSADSSYVGVAGVYNTSTNTYSDEADIFGQQITTTPIAVTGTIYNANGTVDSVCQWIVTVTEAAEDTTSVSRYFDVDQVEHCTLYYSINGGELVQVNGTGVSIIPGTDSPYKVVDGTWYGNLSLIFFAAPDEGYALTHMYVETSDNQYYVLSDGNGDVKNSSAWPLLSTVDTDALYTSGGVTYSLDMIASRYLEDKTDIYDDVKNSSSIWKSESSSSYHGFRWALLEGYVTVGRLEELYSKALELGCTGVTTVTRDKKATDKCGTKTNPVSICAVAQKLPTIEKSITSSTSSVGIGDSIDYKIEVTIPKTDAVVKYWNGNTLTSGDTSTISYTNMSVGDSLVKDIGWNTTSATSSTTSDQTFTVTYSLTLTTSNFKDIVKDGKIVNTATLNYAYKASYGSGNYSANDFTEASVAVVLPSYVVDFGLPVTIDLSSIIESYGAIKTINEATTYGTVSWDETNKQLTYTATQAIQAVDYIEIDLKEGDYAIAIYPATTVYYEEYFAKGVSGDWSTISSSTTAKSSQTAEEVGKKKNVYGFDSNYNTVGASNGTSATSQKASVATFTFTGTGVDIYTNNTKDSGILMAWVKDSNGKTVKVIQVDTHMANGTTDATNRQEVNNAYNVPVVTLHGLEKATYTVELRHIGQSVTTEEGQKTVAYKAVSLDGFRVHGTLASDTDVYKTDLEDNPEYYQLRDMVLNAIGVSGVDSQYGDPTQLAGQVYDASADATGIITDESVTYADSTTVKDLLDNGPKNEIYLYANQTLTFKVQSSRLLQLGMKALNASTAYTLKVDGKEVKAGSMDTSVDMFYKLNEATAENHTYTVSVTNNGTGILSITDLKICDDPNAAFVELTAEDIEKILVPTEYADATLNIVLNDVAGNSLVTTALTANGEVGETATFTAAAIEEAVATLVPEGYELKEVSYADQEVAYGEEASVTFIAEEIEEEQPTTSVWETIVSVVKNIFDKLFGWF